MPAAFIFDVFGTLVDWRSSVSAQLDKAFSEKGIGLDPALIADEWRDEYDPSMAPIRKGVRPYTALDVLHRENLETVLARHDVSRVFSGAEKDLLARAWERLDPWPDSVPGLTRLRTLGLVAPCSNGSISLMAHLARHAGFRWDAILGAEIAQDYKPSAATYLKSCAALRLPPERVMMVACHLSDLEAAKAAGLQTGFFPRPLEKGSAPVDMMPTSAVGLAATDLLDLADQLGA